MNRRKKTLLIVLTVIIGLFILPSLFSINKKQLKTDSGFDSSWDSGGSSWSSSDSGSSWSSSDSGSSWDSSGGSHGGSFGRGNSNFMLIVFFIIFLVVLSTSVKDNSYSDQNLNVFKLAKENTRILAKYNLSKKNVIDSISILFELIEMSVNDDNNDIADSMISQNVRNYYNNLRLRNVLANEKYYIKSAKVEDGFIYNIIENNDGTINIDAELIVRISSAIIPMNKKITDNDYEEMIYSYRVNVKYDGDYYFESITLSSKKNADDFSNMGVVPISNIEERLSNLNLTKEQVLNEAYNIYIDVQLAWMNDTLDDVKNIISDEIYNQYQAQLSTLRVKKQQNIMNDFSYIDGYIVDIKETKKVCYIKVMMSVNCKDYLINKTNGKVIRGDSRRTNYYRYSLIFMLGLNNNTKCPNCGADLNKEGSSTVCEYCGSKISKYSDNMVLVEKKMISQSY